MFWLLFAATGSLIFSSVLILTTGGLNGTIVDTAAYSHGLQQLDAETGYPSPVTRFRCEWPGDSESFFSDSRCVIGDNTKQPRALLWGDSNAGHFAGFLETVGAKMGFASRVAMFSMCPPFIDAGEKYPISASSAYHKECARYINLIRAEMTNYNAAIIGGAWYTYEKFNQQMLSELEGTLDYLKSLNKPAIIFAQIPLFFRYDRYCPLKQLRLPWLDCEQMAAGKNKGELPVNTAIRELAAKYDNTLLIDFNNLICTQEVCSPYADGKRIYFDGSHLSYSGSQLLGERFLSMNIGLSRRLSKLVSE